MLSNLFAFAVLGSCAGYYVWRLWRNLVGELAEPEGQALAVRDGSARGLAPGSASSPFKAIALAQARWGLEGFTYPEPAESLPAWSRSDVQRTLRDIESL